MIEIRETETFSTWLGKLADHTARSRVQTRIDRLQMGNPGDVKPVGEGVSEMRIDHGPGYRIYFVQHGNQFILLLAGGNKRTQAQDIKTAIGLARELKGSP
jgi:putative addiction module killer protein